MLNEINQPKPIEERIEQFSDQTHIDITNGFNQVKNAQELKEWYFLLLLKKGISRLPILGFNDGKVFMLGGKNPRLEHATLLEQLENYSQEDILFATAFENISSVKPEGAYLELNENAPMYISLQDGSDQFGTYLNQGKETLEEIFNIKDVEVHIA